MDHEIQTWNYIQQFDAISEIYHTYHTFIIPLDISLSFIFFFNLCFGLYDFFFF